VAHADSACTIRFVGVDRVRLEEGWVSERYGTRERAPVLVGSVAGPLPIRCGYRLVPAVVRVGARASAATA